MSKHRVHLAAHVFATLEIEADTPEQAFTIAEAHAKDSKLHFRTVPIAFRVELLVPGEVKAGVQGFNWVRLERVPLDPSDHFKGWQWRLGRVVEPAA